MLVWLASMPLSKELERLCTELAATKSRLAVTVTKIPLLKSWIESTNVAVTARQAEAVKKKAPVACRHCAPSSGGCWRKSPRRGVRRTCWSSGAPPAQRRTRAATGRGAPSPRKPTRWRGLLSWTRARVAGAATARSTSPPRCRGAADAKARGTAQARGGWERKAARRTGEGEQDDRRGEAGCGASQEAGGCRCLLTWSPGRSRSAGSC